jgi:hypothetical protein
MFFGKRIKKLEQIVAQLKGELAVAQVEVARQKGLVSMLTKESLVTNFDTDEYIDLMAEQDGGREKVDEILKMKEAYEKKLRRFIRSVTSKKKITAKLINDGKEKPEAKQ